MLKNVLVKWKSKCNHDTSQDEASLGKKGKGSNHVNAILETTFSLEATPVLETEKTGGQFR